MKKKYFYTVLFVIIAILINTFLYLYNNKYLHDDIKGSYGVVDYTNSKQDIHFLSEGWQLYLDEDQINNLDNKNPDYITGIYKPLEVNKATYRLQIIDDNPPQFYTLIIPEIFSEYSLYINGTLIHQQDFIQTQQININGEKRLDCILIVNNQSHYYNGQVFPIIFGESQVVSNMHNLQNYSYSLLIFISLLSSIIMITIYTFTGKEKKYLYASSLSILFTIYLSHYFIHQFVPVFSALTYITEDICYYMSLFVLFVFIIRFYLQRHLSKAFIVCSSIGIIIYCLLPYYYIWANHLLYFIGLFLKIIIILLLVYVLFKHKKSVLLYHSLLFFVISYCFDFIYNFEPIYFGWNTEIAAVLLLISYNIDVIQKQVRLYKKYSILKIKTESMIEYTHTKAHDLKTPMTTMQGYVELLQEELSDNDKKHVLEKLEEKISTLTLRINQLQNLEYENCHLNLQNTNLKLFLEQIISEFQVQTVHKNIEIVSDLIDINSHIDPYYFKIVIENIIMNAIEHTQESTIFIKSHKIHKEIVIEIINYGDIITPQQISHIFEQGFSTKGLSRGYGLYISKKIVELHHASLSVDSDLSNGTRFTIILTI